MITPKPIDKIKFISEDDMSKVFAKVKEYSNKGYRMEGGINIGSKKKCVHSKFLRFFDLYDYFNYYYCTMVLYKE